MKLLSCNVNGRVGAALTRQMSALLDREPDVLALQEVTSRTYAAWCEGLLNDNGPVIQRRDPVWGEAINARWTLAEERLIANPEMRDVYRDVHQAGQPFPASHVTGRAGRRTAHRYDRIFTSSAITTEGCTYLCDWLDEGVPGGRLSDHAPVEARLSLASHA